MADEKASGSSLNRREFLKRTGLGAAAGLALASQAPFGAAAVGPNDTIQIGCIGVGRRGGRLCRGLIDRSRERDSKLKVTAICDVWDERVKSFIDYGGGEAKGFRDYRELLDLDDIDAVVIDGIKVAARPNEDHMSNWLDCLRTREKPNLHARLAYQVEVPIALSVLSYREGVVARFDAQNEEAIV